MHISESNNVKSKGLSWTHRLHGSMFHDLVIYLCESIIVRKGGILLPTADFKKKYKSPCEPDVFFKVKQKKREGNRVREETELYVVECETKATETSKNKKFEQYKQTLAGLTDLIILDFDKDYTAFAGKEKPEIYDDWKLLREFIEERLPI